MEEQEHDHGDERRVDDSQDRIGKLDDGLEPQVADEHADDAIDQEQHVVRDLAPEQRGEEVGRRTHQGNGRRHAGQKDDGAQQDRARIPEQRLHYRHEESRLGEARSQ